MSGRRSDNKVSRGQRNSNQPEIDLNWGSVTDVFRRFNDLDINQIQPSELAKLQGLKAKADKFNQTVERRSMIRYVTVIFDFSKAALLQDIEPNRISVVKELFANFISEFWEQNPLSKLSIIATLQEQAIVISDFSKGKAEQLARLKQFEQFEGNPSYQNALELAAA